MTSVFVFDSTNNETVENGTAKVVTEVSITTSPMEGAKSVLKFSLDDVEYFAEQDDSGIWVSDIGRMKTIRVD